MNGHAIAKKTTSRRAARWLRDRVAPDFWQILHQRRNDLSLTQAQVAARLGLSQSAVSNRERSRVLRLPSPGQFWAYADILGLSSAEMLEAAGYLE